MDDTHEAQQALDYYRQQSDALGSRLLRVQTELRDARRDAHRQRVITAIIRRLYTLDGQEPWDQSLENRLGESLVALLVEFLQIDCVALLTRTPDDSLVIEHALGLDTAFQLPLLAPLPEQASSSTPEQVALEVRKILETHGLLRWLWSTSAHSGKMLLFGHRHTQVQGLGIAFEAGDQAIAKAALSVYLALTEQRRTNRALHSAKINYHTLFESAQDAFVIIDAQSRQLIEINTQAQSLLGASLDEIQQRPLTSWLADPDPARWRHCWRRALSGKSTQSECQLRNVAGESLWIDLRLVKIGEASDKRLLLVGHDITKHKQAQARLQEYAFRDELTRLPNRALLCQRLEQALERQRKEPGFQFALFFLDLDRFKNINNSLGHSLGDRLLVAIGQRLQDQIRPTDTIARLGGDEFLLLMEDVEGPNAAKAIAGRFERALLRPFTVRGQEIFTSASIGIVLADLSYKDPEAMMRDADIAMYRAKRQEGREQRHALFDPAMHASELANMEMERDLRRALEQDELLLYYQPIVRLSDGQITGFEALVRWQHPERGLVPPNQFIPLAENTLQILDISRFVLCEAARQALIWSERFPIPPTINVNVSGRQFINSSMAAETSRLVAETGCPAALINLEITESAILANKAMALAGMQGLHAQGFSLYMDDFGTGYSSLSYLHQFPFDKIKIDASFVKTLSTEPSAVAIATAIIKLAESLNKGVVAEGIETEEQLAILQQLGCDVGQGYLFSRPVDASAAEELLRSSGNVLPRSTASRPS